MKKNVLWRSAPSSSIVCAVLAIGCSDRSLLDDSAKDSNVSWSGETVQTQTCTSDAQCAPYLKCVVGGTVGCYHGGCAGFNNQVVDFDCIKGVTESNPPAPSGTVCGVVQAPPEQQKYDVVDVSCHFSEGLLAGYNQSRPWLQITADDPKSTVTVYELSGYCIKPDSTVVANSGTAVGKPAITWAGHWYRDTWFRAKDLNGNVVHAEDEHKAIPVQGDKTAYAVPINPLLLHMGHEGWDITGCREIVVKAVISTTGDAKVQVGLNYNVGTDLATSRESGVSDWKSCTSGTVTLTTPRSDTKSCDDIAATACVPTTEVCNGKDDDCDNQTDEDNVCAPPTENGCPATGIRVSPGPELLNPCPGLITETWNDKGQVIASAPGQPLVFDGYWHGYAYIEAVCNGKEHSWPPVYTSNQAAGFVQICINGKDETSNTFVCQDLKLPKTRPTVPTFLEGVGMCPP